MRKLILIKYIFLLIVSLAITNVLAQINYHLTDFSGPEPIIKERCVEPTKIENLKLGYISEYIDTLGRCNRIEFYKSKDKLWSSIDMPSIITYTWTDSGVIESLYSDDYSPLTYNGKMIRPNKIQYMTSDSFVTKIRKFFNDSLLSKSIITQQIPLEDASFFYMYTGCSIKHNERYGLQF